MRARTTAIGTPTRTQSSVLAAEVWRLRTNAALDDSEVIRSPKLHQSTRATIATSGTRTNAAPRAAGQVDPARQPVSTRDLVRREPGLLQDRLALLAEDQLDEVGGQVGLVAVLDGGDRVGVHRGGGLGEVDAEHGAGRTDDVGDVDEAGVRLPGGDLAEDVGDRLLLAHRRQLDAGRLRGLLRGRRRTGPRGRRSRA